MHETNNPPLSEVCAWQAREYTVRHLCQREKLLTVDFVLHARGIAESWLRSAVVGDHLGIIGTRMSRELPEQPHILAIGDATALPALARLVNSTPESSCLRIFLLADQESLGRSFPSSNNADITWVDPLRDPISQLMQLLDDSPLQHGTWAWIAGEASQVGMIRRLLVDDHFLEKERIHFTGYWKLNTPAIH
ncbi:siderophore-interacting protein [Arthrobacter psychrolactophilus]